LSLTLREQHGLRIIANRVPRKILVPERNEATGKWRILRNEEVYEMYSSPNIIRVNKSRRMRRAGHLASMGERGGAKWVQMKRPECERPLGSSMRRWKDNIKKDLQEAV
jgi:hypothetical protein